MGTIDNHQLILDRERYLIIFYNNNEVFRELSKLGFEIYFNDERGTCTLLYKARYCEIGILATIDYIAETAATLIFNDNNCCYLDDIISKVIVDEYQMPDGMKFNSDASIIDKCVLLKSIVTKNQHAHDISDKALLDECNPICKFYINLVNNIIKYATIWEKENNVNKFHSIGSAKNNIDKTKKNVDGNDNKITKTNHDLKNKTPKIDFRNANQPVNTNNNFYIITDMELFNSYNIMPASSNLKYSDLPENIKRYIETYTGYAISIGIDVDLKYIIYIRDSIPVKELIELNGVIVTKEERASAYKDIDASDKENVPFKKHKFEGYTVVRLVNTSDSSTIQYADIGEVCKGGELKFMLDAAKKETVDGDNCKIIILPIKFSKIKEKLLKIGIF